MRHYNDLNHMGYEGDTFIHTELQKLIEKFEIDQIIETGTFKGYTTKRLTEFGLPVSTIEFDVETYKAASVVLAETKVMLRLGNSGSLLKHMITGKNVLFYLDAHWHDYCPLHDELTHIANSKVTPVIFIHDFKVPERADLGYDTYNGKPFDFSFIESKLKVIYGETGYNYHYNTKADGPKRGCIYIYPKN